MNIVLLLFSASWAVRAVLKNSAILLQYLTFEGFFGLVFLWA